MYRARLEPPHPPCDEFFGADLARRALGLVDANRRERVQDRVFRTDEEDVEQPLDTWPHTQRPVGSGQPQIAALCSLDTSRYRRERR